MPMKDIQLAGEGEIFTESFQIQKSWKWTNIFLNPENIEMLWFLYPETADKLQFPVPEIFKMLRFLDTEIMYMVD